MKRKLFLIMAFCLSALMITGCSDQGDGTPSETSAVQTEKTDTTEADAVPFSETVGVWSYNDEFVFHSSDGNRYLLKEDSSGTVQSTDGKSYSVQECDYRLYQIKHLENDKLTVSEGRYFETALNSKDYPDGYKKLVITYEKSDLFDADTLEKAVKGESVSAETMAETQGETEAVTTESETSAPETESVTETEQAQSETESETSESEASTSADEDASTAEEAEYAGIYKKIEDFLETDNYKQKDPGNRSLEVFNYLHNLADANIEEASITNDTAKNEVSFKCYEKYTIIVNNTDGTITVNTES
ncbi:MAG: hypothetical protein E7496_04040 [Ruminococcus sp.]|nr:hypothetical protein [Ruminococcus sp.]